MERWLIERRWLKAGIRRYIRSRLSPTYMSFMDCTFLLHPADNYSELHLWKYRESAEYVGTSTVAKLLENTDAVIVDVGGNAGLFVLPVLKAAGKTAQALIFEPNPVMLARLRKNIALNQFENVKVFECAVSDEGGQSPLFFPAYKNLGQGRINVEYEGKHGRTGVNVEIRTLLECLDEANVGKIDFLKVDVEGLEDRVIYPLLMGPEPLLPKLLYFEVEHREHWKYPLMETLEAKGYKLLDDFGLNHLYELQTLK